MPTHTQHRPPVSFHVPARPSAVRGARRRISAAVRRWGAGLGEDDLAVVELLSSEIITNAITHAGCGCDVSVRWTGARVRVEVTDHAVSDPYPREPADDAETGRGLLMVHDMAADWGCRPCGNGKTVWFEVAAPNAAWLTAQPPGPGSVTAVTTC